MNMGSFIALEQQELFDVDGGDNARQRLVAAARASGESSDDNAAIGAQATVTGWVLSLIGLATAIPTGGASLTLAVVSLGVSTIGVASLGP